MKAHIIHFEVRHRAGSHRRDITAYKRAEEMRAHRLEFVEEIEVYRKDNYVCQLCGRSLILNERPRHPNGASVDHVIWLSKGGAHTYANTRAAHLACNTRQGWQYKKESDRRMNRKAASRKAAATRRRNQNREMLLEFMMWVIVVAVVLILLRLI